MVTRVTRRGKHLWLRLPKAVAREAGFRQGDTVDILAEDRAVVVRPVRTRYVLKGLVSGITATNRHAETDWGAPVGREV